MVIYSNVIKDFLDKIYFYELTHRNDLEFPLYHYYEGKLYDIDKLSRHTPSTTFPMSRDKLFGLVVGRLEFGYSFDGVNACVEYYVNLAPQNDWFDWLIRESLLDKKKNKITRKELKNVINECVDKSLNEHKTLNETTALDYLYYGDYLSSHSEESKFGNKHFALCIDENGCKLKKIYERVMDFSPIEWRLFKQIK